MQIRPARDAKCGWSLCPYDGRTYCRATLFYWQCGEHESRNNITAPPAQPVSHSAILVASWSIASLWFFLYSMIFAGVLFVMLIVVLAGGKKHLITTWLTAWITRPYYFFSFSPVLNNSDAVLNGVGWFIFNFYCSSIIIHTTLDGIQATFCTCSDTVK